MKVKCIHDLCPFDEHLEMYTCTCIGIVYLQLGLGSPLASKPSSEILRKVKEAILKLVMIEIKR